MGYIMLGGILFFSVRWWIEASETAHFMVIAVPVSIVVLLILWSVYATKREKALIKENTERQKEFINNKLIPYKPFLAKKRTQLITTDDYGDIDDAKWRKEIVKFFNEKIGSIPGEIALPTLTQVISGDEIAEIIDAAAKDGEKILGTLFHYDKDMDGIEYEHFCAEILRKVGWVVKVSQASNDQGVDIVAIKGHHAVAIQCKKYSSPVGNKAVQEVASGSVFYKANKAAVVTNNSYTPSAKQLAASTGVLLLHHSDLGNLDKLVIS